MIKLALSYLIILVSCGPALAIDAEYTTFNVNGRAYHVPIPNKDTRNDFYYVHKALGGDETARALLLGDLPEKKIYIGDEDAIRWLVLMPKGERIIEYKIGASHE